MNFYKPAEDSYFLAEIVKNYIQKIKNKNILVLDMGTGSGIQSENLINLGIKPNNITAIDINENAIKQTKKLKIKTLKSDLFEKINNQKYNLIIFNPPYLPENKFDKKPDTTGGKLGDETIIRFTQQLKSHLAENGICFLLTSSLTPEKTWKEEIKKQKLKLKKLADKKLFFEKLYVWEIK